MYYLTDFTDYICTVYDTKDGISENISHEDLKSILKKGIIVIGAYTYDDKLSLERVVSYEFDLTLSKLYFMYGLEATVKNDILTALRVTRNISTPIVLSDFFKRLGMQCIINDKDFSVTFVFDDYIDVSEYPYSARSICTSDITSCNQHYFIKQLYNSGSHDKIIDRQDRYCKNIVHYDFYNKKLSFNKNTINKYRNPEYIPYLMNIAEGIYASLKNLDLDAIVSLKNAKMNGISVNNLNKAIRAYRGFSSLSVGDVTTSLCFELYVGGAVLVRVSNLMLLGIADVRFYDIINKIFKKHYEILELKYKSLRWE